jgi:hypothetical protein
METKRIKIAQAKNDPRLATVNLDHFDENNNGYIERYQDFSLLFTQIDHLDANGDLDSIAMGTVHNPTIVADVIATLHDLAETSDTRDSNTIASIDASMLQDTALKNAFPSGFDSIIKRGAKSTQVVAIQYALGRLGHLNDLCDGDFGRKTQGAVVSFQKANQNIEVTGRVNAKVLTALDNAVAHLDLRPPALKSSRTPLDYLSDFYALGMPKLNVNRRGENTRWDSETIQKVYGQFVENYWEILKRNKVEADCKSLALFFMDQFRKQLAEDCLIFLPLPKSSHGSFKKRRWVIQTAVQPRGLFSRVSKLLQDRHLQVQRSGYETVKKIQALDPMHSMIYGVNVKYPKTSAKQVAKACSVLYPWMSSQSNRGNALKAEVPIHRLQAGNLIFIDHTGNGSYDHTVNVVKVNRDGDNNVRQLILAVGSYDDVRDSNADTHVTSMAMVNQYVEEVIIDFNEYQEITQSEVSYSSEPRYIVHTRYTAKTTIMEQKSNGKLKISRW